jgi:hypothetical protein
MAANVLSILASATFARSFVNLKQLAEGVGLLALVSIAATLAGEFVVSAWLPAMEDGRLSSIASGAVAILVFAGGMYSANVGAIRSLALRRS